MKAESVLVVSSRTSADKENQPKRRAKTPKQRCAELIDGLSYFELTMLGRLVRKRRKQMEFQRRASVIVYDSKRVRTLMLKKVCVDWSTSNRLDTGTDRGFGIFVDGVSLIYHEDVADDVWHSDEHRWSLMYDNKYLAMFALKATGQRTTDKKLANKMTKDLAITHRELREFIASLLISASMQTRRGVLATHTGLRSPNEDQTVKTKSIAALSEMYFM